MCHPRSSALKGRNPVVRMAAPPYPAPSGRNTHLYHRAHGVAMGYRVWPRWGIIWAERDVDFHRQNGTLVKSPDGLSISIAPTGCWFNRMTDLAMENPSPGLPHGAPAGTGCACTILPTGSLPQSLSRPRQRLWKVSSSRSTSAPAMQIRPVRHPVRRMWRSRKQVLHHVSVHVGQAALDAVVIECQPLMIDA
jgi:hypothetical protein